ncbi:ASCH domain-containing protein [Meridianimarinicoccus sp. RP-17]|uniref:ASCH domain-containing protein n=1 Tax=Meridianimarinicoccus zhengii TaxID=2056810 RepID=UPI001C9AADCD|nr:ASCH domain-containing protein [Phycocomes zhengii]
MVAYSFKQRFCDDIAAGRKRQTIRGHRKRHARVGEPVQLYFGMRTRACRKLIGPDPICTAVVPIKIGVPQHGGEPALVSLEGAPFRHVDDAFAIADGFWGWADFTLFWRDTHGAGNFSGMLIEWAPHA